MAPRGEEFLTGRLDHHPKSASDAVSVHPEAVPLARIEAAYWRSRGFGVRYTSHCLWGGGVVRAPVKVVILSRGMGKGAVGGGGGGMVLVCKTIGRWEIWGLVLPGRKARAWC